MKTEGTIIFTDGSSRGNPGPGGWAAIVIKNGKRKMEKGGSEMDLVVKEIGGYEAMTTNNRMELTAAVKGMKQVDDYHGSSVIVYTDSSYVINGITKWVKGWKRNGWQTKTKQDVSNKDLWEMLDSATKGKNIEWKYVGGHLGIVGNERADHISTDHADGNKVRLYDGPIKGYDLPNILDISFDDKKSSSKKSGKDRNRAKAFSYVSCIDGVIEVHHTWAECEKRVKGAKGARYKKSLNAEEEARIIREFEAV